jgi:DNA invertase Pin-like site-specific DNA recombinase
MSSVSKASIVPVYGYLRVSGKVQVQGDGFPRQRATITKYAADHKLNVSEWFEEKGVPGKTEWADRPAWVDMLAKVPKGSEAVILIEKLDRLARDLMVQEHIIADLHKRGITLISAHEPDLCSNDPTRKLMRQIMGAIAEYDKTMLVLKLNAGRARKRSQGGHAEGPPAYGSDPRAQSEQAVVDRIRQLVAAGPYTYQAMADTLNGEGTYTRHGKHWTPMMVWRVIRRDPQLRHRQPRRTIKAAA